MDRRRPPRLVFLLGVTAAALIIVVGLFLIVVGAVMNNP